MIAWWRTAPAAKAAVWTLPVVLLVGMWRFGDKEYLFEYWRYASIWPGTALLFVGPILALAAAFHTGRLRRWGVRDLNCGRPWWAILVGELAPFVSVGLIVFAVGWLEMLFWMAGSPGAPDVRWVLIGVLNIVEFVLLGGVLGASLPAVFALPLALAGTFFGASIASTWLAAWPRYLFARFDYGLSVDDVYDPAVFWGRGLFATAVCIACLALYRRSMASTRPWHSLTAAGATAVLFVSAGVVVHHLGYDPVVERDAAEQRCAPHGKIQVCLFPEQERLRSDLARALDEALPAWRALGLEDPTTISGVPATGDDDRSWSVVVVNSANPSTVRDALASEALFSLAKECAQPTPESGISGEVAGLLLRDQAGFVTPEEFADELARTTGGLKAPDRRDIEVRRAWFMELTAAAKSCIADAVPVVER